MLKLRNINLNNNILSANYHPEDSDDFGIVAIDVKTRTVVNRVLSSQDGIFPLYFEHALTALNKLAEKSELPKEKLVMWH